MPIVAASVVPHSPLLLPSIAKQHAGLFSQTTNTLNALAADWYAAKPDAVIVLSPHGLPKNTLMAVHSAKTFIGGFADYGDMVTTIKAIPAIGMMHQLRSAAEKEHLVLPLQTFEQLDYGTSIPLSFLLTQQPQIPVCSVLIGTKQPDQLLRLAAVLRELTSASRQRCLVIASCDMTRRQERTPDTRRRPTAEERTASAAIVAVDPSQLTATIPQSSTCGYGPLLTVVSLLHGLATEGTILSFEAPLGVGLLTASFTFNA